MASTASLFFLPPNIIRPTNMSTTLKAKRQSCSSFFITDILGNHSRSSSPDNKLHLTSTTDKDGGESGEEDDRMLHDSEENGKTLIYPIDIFNQSKFCI
jgi:hypothetical protein